MRILVVDDEKDMQRLFVQVFRRELRKGQIQLDFAFSALEALDYLNNHSTDGLAMVLSDINMPQMSGLELLEQIRKNYTDLKVILVTAYSDPSNRVKAEELGAFDYLTKPIDFKVLKSLIFSTKQ